MAVRCPKCKNQLLQRAGGVTKLRTEGVHTFDEAGHCHARCHWCKAEVELPIRLQEGIEVPTETFFVKPG